MSPIVPEAMGIPVPQVPAGMFDPIRTIQLSWFPRQLIALNGLGNAAVAMNGGPAIGIDRQIPASWCRPNAESTEFRDLSPCSVPFDFTEKLEELLRDNQR